MPSLARGRTCRRLRSVLRPVLPGRSSAVEARISGRIGPLAVMPILSRHLILTGFGSRLPI